MTRSGGHSEYSTIAAPGLILDLSRFTGVTVDAAAQTATLTGGVLGRAVASKLADQGLFTALANSHALGAIPYFLNGGNSLVNSFVGFASDQIVSARVVTATGEIVQVSDDENAELLYALRGAGQYFGVVTQLVVRAYPFSLLGNESGEAWTGAFVFPQSRAAEVADAFEAILNDQRYRTAGSLIIGAPPPHFQPALVVAPRLFGPDLDERQVEAFKGLYALQPLVARGSRVRIDALANALEALNAHGDYKRLRLAGFAAFPREAWLQVPGLWAEMTERCADAKKSSFIFAWDSGPPKRPAEESATGMHAAQFWLTNHLWYADPANAGIVDEMSEKVIVVMRQEQREDEYIDLPNGHRSGSLRYRHPGKGRLEKLMELKRQWDPKGVFTKQLL